MIYSFRDDSNGLHYTRAWILIEILTCIFEISHIRIELYNLDYFKKAISHFI